MYEVPDTPEELGEAGRNLVTPGGFAGQGCLTALGVAIVLLAGAILVLSRLLGNSSPSSDGEEIQVDIEAAELSTEAASQPGIGTFIDPANPNALVPAAGEWAIDNVLFVPNCGGDDDLTSDADTGTIDVWAAGAVLELSGGEAAIVLERVSVSDGEATYTGAFGFVEFALTFDSAASFDAEIRYAGDDECVSRMAGGRLVAGDDARQHGVAEFAGGVTPDAIAPEQADTEAHALITIDGVEYEFGAEGPAATCDPDLFGRFFVVLYANGFADSLNIELIPDGSEPSTVEVKLGAADLDLVADESEEWAAVEPGSSRVIESTIDGATATGTVSFINEDRAFNPANLPLPTIDGTFEVDCGS